MKIGFPVADIAPGPGIRMTGQGMKESPAEGVHSPLNRADIRIGLRPADSEARAAPGQSVIAVLPFLLKKQDL